MTVIAAANCTTLLQSGSNDSRHLISHVMCFKADADAVSWYSVQGIPRNLYNHVYTYIFSQVLRTG